MSDPIQTPDTPEPAPVSLQDLTDAQRDTWLKTGDLPASKVEPETPHGSTDDKVPSQPEGETPPVESKSEKPLGKPRDDIRARLGQETERKKAAEARAEVAERKAADLEAKLAAWPTPVAPAAAGSPADATKADAKPLTHIELVRKYQGAADWPKMDDFVAAGFDDPYAAMLAAQAAYIGQKQFAERDQAESERTIREKAETNVDRTFKGLREEFPEADPSVLRDLQGQSAPIFAQLLFESPISVKLLNYFSNDPAEARRVAAMEPLAAAHALGMVESALSTAAPSRVATPTKTVSSAPEPPQTLGSRHTPDAGDELDQALRDGDTGRYIEIQNTRELAAMKAGRR